MADASATFASARSARDVARSKFSASLAQVRADLAARGVGSRIAHRAGDQAIDIFDDAVDIADENRAVVAGTVGAIVLWLLRNPLIDWSTELYDWVRKRLR